MTDFIPRHIASVIEDMARTFPVVLVTGSRQVGKTTLLQNKWTSASYVTFDRLDALRAAEDEPERFLAALPKPAVIDEVQYAPDLFRYIKLDADEHRREKGRLLLTGSQRYLMMQGVDESLAGRAGIVEMLGLSVRERRGDSFAEPFEPTSHYVEKRHPKPMRRAVLWEMIFRGDLPELSIDSAMNPTRYYDSYIETYLRRDVRDLAHVGDLGKFNRFIATLALYHGKMLNKSDLANTVDVSFQTVDRWLSVLESSSIIYILKPFAANVTKRLVKTPKLYFLNSGLAARLCGFSSAEELEASQQAGVFFEGFVISEILKSHLNASGVMPNLYFYRDSNGREIDLVIERGGKLYPIEIKKAEIARPSDVAAFSQLDAIKGYERQEGAVVCRAQAALPLSDHVWILPVSYV